MTDHHRLLAATAEGRLPDISPEEVCTLGQIIVEGWIHKLPPHMLTGPAWRVEPEARAHLCTALSELGFDPKGYRLHVSPGTANRVFDVQVVVLSAIDRLAALADNERPI